MNKTSRNLSLTMAVAFALLLSASLALGQVAPQGDPVAKRQMGVADLYIRNADQPLSTLPADLGLRLRPQLNALGVAGNLGFYDLRAGVWGGLVAKQPLVPGSGVGNSLTWASLGRTAPVGDEAYKAAVWQAFKAWLDANRVNLEVDTAQLAAPTIGTYENGRLVHVNAKRVVNGVPVRSSFVKGTLNSGNLVLYGTHNWGAIDVSTTPSISSEQAKSVVQSRLSGFTITGWWQNPTLVLVPLANGEASAANEGRGLRYRLAWAAGPKVKGSLGGWEALVDAHSGQLLSFADTNQYLQHKKVIGGIFPVSNDGQSPGGIPDGIEQPGHPMSHAYVFDSNGTQLEANSEGLVQVDGEYSTELTGPFLRISDNCGFIDESTVCPALDLGTSGGTDCTVPAGHSLGDTHSARTGFYEVNRLIDQAKSWVGPGAAANQPGPAGWMNRQLLANMNINNSCNAFFSFADATSPTTGSINFYREVSASPNSGRCRNTGEIAAVFDHEWGHGLDFFDDTASVSNPGEAYADMAAIMRLNTSCIGRGFFKFQLCSGDGDPCTECTGVREDDWKKRQSGRPHDLQWILGQNPTVPGGCPGSASPGPPDPPINSGPCGGSTHCEGTIIGEAVWDLLKRDLPCHTKRWETFAGGTVAGGRCTNGATPFMSENSALVLGTRLFYLASPGVLFGFQCDPLVGGCNTDSWYMNMLAADDDNGDLELTPHMVAINDAFTRHGIACGLPPAINGGCTLTPTPTAASTVTAIAGIQSATINWTAVTGATEYWVLRTDGVHGCNFGKTRVAEIAAPLLTFTQNDLLDGLTYYYSVVAVGGLAGIPNDSCAGPMSACASVTPISPNVTTAPGMAIEDTGAEPVIETGDGDPFVDNCEIARLTFNVVNTGGVTLTNVRVTSITPSPAGTQILTPLPIAVPNLGAGCEGVNATAPVTFRFRAGGLPPQSTLTFNVTAQANELPGPVMGTLTVNGTETDLTMGNATFTFETGTEGWTTFSGTFNRTNVPPPGAEGTAFYMKSSSAFNDVCDRSRSPKVRLTSSSTLSLFNQFLTEAEVDPSVGLPFYDRGNVGIVNEAGQTTIVSPNSGRLYNALNTYTGCNNGPGWATSVSQPINLWAQSGWDAAALGAAGFAGQEVQIEVAYGTDALNALEGFQFDQVRLTNILLRINDQQSDICVDQPNRPPNAVDDSASTQMNTPVTINVVANDSDPDGNAFTVTSFTQGSNGSVACTPAGSCTYNPNTNFTGTDTFTYTICDNGTPSLCDTATVTVVVLFECPATATGRFSDDFEPGPEPGWTKDTPVNDNTGFNWSVLIDPFTHSLTHAYSSDAAGLDLKDDRLIAPPQDLSPTSRLIFWHRFTFEDGFDGGVVEVSSDSGSTWVDVGAGNFVTGGYNGVIAPAFDSPIAGRPAWTGSSTFINAMNRVEVNLGAFAGLGRLVRWRLALDPFVLGSIPGTAWWIDDVEITNTLVKASTCPQPPDAVDDSAATDKNTPVNIDVLANDSDPNGDPLTVQNVSDPPNGTVVNNGTSVTYDPDPNFVGTDSFTYQACDPGGLCDTATVTVTVRETQVNHAPVANDDAATTMEDTPVTIEVMANDSDPDGDPITLTSNTQPSNGSVSCTSAGSCTYQPNSGFTGTDSFMYTICDPGNLCDEAEVRITVFPRDPDPTGDTIFLLIDEESIDNGNPPNFFSAKDVNDQIAALARRTELAFFNNAPAGSVITLYTGQVGDEGWFALKTVPPDWNSAGPTPDGLRNFVGNPGQPYPHNVGPGLGTGPDPEKLLDKIRNVTPLRATGLKMLERRRVCAVVFDNNINIGYGPLNGSLKGANLGTVAFEVRSVTKLTGQSSSSLPKVEVRILDSESVCQGPLTLFTNAPTPTSSSQPNDVTP